MLDATVVPKVRFISPFGTTDCNVNHSNAKTHLPPEAGVTQERMLEAVRFSAVLASPLTESEACRMEHPSDRRFGGGGYTAASVVSATTSVGPRSH